MTPERELTAIESTLAWQVSKLTLQRDVLLVACERSLSWLSSYPGGCTLHPGGIYDQMRAAIEEAKL